METSQPLQEQGSLSPWGAKWILYVFAPFLKTRVLLSFPSSLWRGDGLGPGNAMPAFAAGLTPPCPWASLPSAIKYPLALLWLSLREKLPGKECPLVVQ